MEFLKFFAVFSRIFVSDTKEAKINLSLASKLHVFPTREEIADRKHFKRTLERFVRTVTSVVSPEWKRELFRFQTNQKENN